MTKALIGSLLLLLCTTVVPVIAGGMFSGAPPEVAPSGLVGQPAPDFGLTAIDGSDYRLSSLRGRVVLVNFWASWCAPCAAEMPSLDRLARSYPMDRFIVLGINVEGKTATQLQGFLDRTPHGFPILLDRKGEVQQRYGVRQLPESFLLDRQGQIVKRYIGALDWTSAEVRRNVEFLLSSQGER